jgi:chondroitin AC lyase
MAEQRGRWSDIGAGSDALVTVPTFNLWIDHGAAPKDATYEYLVFPAISPDQAKRYATVPPIRTLANTVNVQAAYSSAGKLAEVVFRQPGELRTPLGLVQTDHACALLVREVPGGWNVTAADPAHGTGDLTVSVSSNKIVLHLPKGALAGSGVSASIQRAPLPSK